MTVKLRVLVLTRLIPALASLLIVLGITGVFLIRGSVNQNYLNSLNTTLLSVRSQLDTLQYKAQSLGRELLFSEPMMHYIGTPDGLYRDIAMEPRVLALFQRTINGFSNLESISLVTADNSLLLQVKEDFDPRVNTLANHDPVLVHLQNIRADYHQDFARSADHPLFQFTFSYTDALSPQSATTYLVLEFNLEQIAATARQLWLQSGLMLALVDNSGDVILTPDDQSPLNRALAEVHSQLSPDRKPHEFSFERTAYTYLALPTGSATLVSLVPNSSINEKGVRFASLALVLIGLLTLLGILLGTLFINRSIVEPLGYLSTSIRQRVNGGKPLPSDRFKVEEIRSLAETFNEVFTAEQDARNQIQRLAYFDTLTGLANRRLFFSHLSRLVAAARRSGERLAVLFIDLDNFKYINDHYGHHLGDEVLVEFGERVRHSTRESDLVAIGGEGNDDQQEVARLAGDEFAVLLTNLHDNLDAGKVAERILSRLSHPFHVGETTLQVAASIGIALYPDDARNGQQLVQFADAAMYQAKMLGRSTYAYFSKELSRSRQRQIDVREALQVAIQNEEFEMVFLPYVEAVSHRIKGAEVLLRWQSAALGEVTPDEFIPIAETAGLVREIDTWVLDRAMGVLESWQDAELPDISLAVNISPVELRNREFPGWLSDQLGNYAIHPSRLEIEVAEKHLAKAESRTIEILRQVRNIGVKVLLDDFGSGFTSFNHLKSLPLDRLKIDRDLINKISIDGEHVQLADVIMLLSQTYNLTAIAEGVETAAQVKYLEEAGCDFLQGYYFSRPLSLPQLETLLRDRRLVLTGCENLSRDRDLPPALVS